MYQQGESTGIQSKHNYLFPQPFSPLFCLIIFQDFPQRNPSPLFVLSMTSTDFNIPENSRFYSDTVLTIILYPLLNSFLGYLRSEASSASHVLTTSSWHLVLDFLSRHFHVCCLTHSNSKSLAMSCSSAPSSVNLRMPVHYSILTVCTFPSYFNLTLLLLSSTMTSLSLSKKKNHQEATIPLLIPKFQL